MLLVFFGVFFGFWGVLFFCVFLVHLFFLLLSFRLLWLFSLKKMGSLVLKTCLFVFMTARGILFVVFSGLARGLVREFSTGMSNVGFLMVVRRFCWILVGG